MTDKIMDIVEELNGKNYVGMEQDDVEHELLVLSASAHRIIQYASECYVDYKTKTDDEYSEEDAISEWTDLLDAELYSDCCCGIW